MEPCATPKSRGSELEYSITGTFLGLNTKIFVMKVKNQIYFFELNIILFAITKI
jgi:hypothetical protein